MGPIAGCIRECVFGAELPVEVVRSLDDNLRSFRFTATRLN